MGTLASVIYEPTGRAREYAPLACNLYDGCSHGCVYCYAPTALRKKRATFHDDPRPRKNIIPRLRVDAGRMNCDLRPVLLCFSCDPYQPCEKKYLKTRQAIHVLYNAGLRARILTKNGAMALRDIETFKECKTEVGISLSFGTDAWRNEWEPFAGTIEERLNLLRHCLDAGVFTWASVEPVIDPWEALSAIGLLRGRAKIIKVGKINHHAAMEASVNWSKFLGHALQALQGTRYYIKDDLWAFADFALRSRYAQWTADAHTDRAWQQ